VRKHRVVVETMVIGHGVIVLPTKYMVSLTQQFSDNPLVKNLKSLNELSHECDTGRLLYPSCGYGIQVHQN